MTSPALEHALGLLGMQLRLGTALELCAPKDMSLNSQLFPSPHPRSYKIPSLILG